MPAEKWEEMNMREKKMGGELRKEQRVSRMGAKTFSLRLSALA